MTTVDEMNWLLSTVQSAEIRRRLFNVVLTPYPVIRVDVANADATDLLLYPFSTAIHLSGTELYDYRNGRHS